MNLAHKRNWIALLAGLFLFSNVAGAVQRCVHEASKAAPSAPAAQHDHADHAQAADTEDDCCNTAADDQGGLPLDCCAVFSNDHRSFSPPATSAVGSAETVAVHEVPAYAAWSIAATPTARPVFRIAGPPPRVLFKNFRV